jgi:1-acyl-sn-glycerol-3-phosphate acyltransferase
VRRTGRIGAGLIIGAVLALAGCAAMGRVQPYELAPVVGKLTMAVQTVILFPEGGRPLPDAMILEAAFRERPELAGAFAGLPILVRHNGRDVVLLVCSPDGRNAWIEDASWTTGVDREWYAIDPSRPAEFSLDPAAGSGRPAF